jgi:hypothetical protein
MKYGLLILVLLFFITVADKRRESLNTNEKELKRAMRARSRRNTMAEKVSMIRKAKKSNKKSKKEQAMEDAKMKDRFNMKIMDKDDSFRAVELVVPDSIIKNDKELQK